jgi:hypothetical protein
MNRKTLPTQGEKIARHRMLTNALLVGQGITARDLAPLPLYNGNAANDQICALGNEALFTQDTFSEPNTVYATGWKDPEDIKTAMDFIAPPVETGRRFEFKQEENAEEFVLDQDDIRAINAPFKEVEYTGNTELGKTLNKGLTIRRDLDRDTDPTKTQQVLTAKLLRRLYRSEYARVLVLLAASAVNTAKTWATGTPNPVADLRNTALAAQLASGLFPSRIWWASDAWANMQSGFEAGGTTAAGYRYAGQSPDAIAQMVGAQKGLISRAVYQSAAATKSRLGTGLVFLFYAQDGVDMEDPTHIKRFFTPTASGPIRVYSQVDEKFVTVTVEHYSNPLLTNSLGIEALTIS